MFKFKLIKKFKNLNLARFISQVEAFKLKINIKFLSLKSNTNKLSSPYKAYWFAQVITTPNYLKP